MTTSEHVNEIAAALAKAQAAMKNAPLNKTNPHFRSKYADLSGIRDAVTPSLALNGIAVVQTMVPFDGRAAIATRLVHTSGQWFESLVPLPDVQDMQKMGSAITYARRYSLSAICGIAADEDDDANASAEQPKAGPTAIAKPAGYDAWIKALDAYAATHTDGELIAEIAQQTSEERKAYLRADTATLSALRSKAGKNKAKAA